MDDQKGFSLFELITGIAIMGVLAGIAMPVYLSMGSRIHADGVARQIMGDLMWARMRSVSENNDYVVIFGSSGPDLSNDTYYIYDDNDGDYSTVGTETGELVKKVVLPDEHKDIGYGYATGINQTDNVTPLAGDPVTFTPSAGTVWFKFTPDGGSNKSGSIYIIPDEDEVNGRRDKSRAITVKTQTGRVKIFKYNAETGNWE